MTDFEGVIKFRFRASSQLAAELYTDALCTAMRYNKPEIDEKSVEWTVSPVMDDFYHPELPEESERAERERLGLPSPEPQLPRSDVPCANCKRIHDPSVRCEDVPFSGGGV